MTESTEHLRGPWMAVLVREGDVIDGLDGLSPDAVVSVSIRRGNALPVSIDGEMWLPDGTYRSCDVITLWDYLYVADGDPSTDAPARWEQAQAMAAGLNAAHEAVEAAEAETTGAQS